MTRGRDLPPIGGGPDGGLFRGPRWHARAAREDARSRERLPYAEPVDYLSQIHALLQRHPEAHVFPFVHELPGLIVDVFDAGLHVANIGPYGPSPRFRLVAERRAHQRQMDTA